MKMVKATVFTTMLLIGALFVGTMTQARASYIDPGTTSYLFQMAVAGLVGMLYTARQVIKRYTNKEDRQSKK